MVAKPSDRYVCGAKLTMDFFIFDHFSLSSSIPKKSERRCRTSTVLLAKKTCYLQCTIGHTLTHAYYIQPVHK